jgi:hypothetical protein
MASRVNRARRKSSKPEIAMAAGLELCPAESRLLSVPNLRDEVGKPVLNLGARQAVGALA